MAAAPPRQELVAKPQRSGERATMARALVKAGLPADDVDEPGRLFWRFETPDEMPVGFGGLEAFGDHALLRSVLTLPPARGRGMGRAIVEALEVEARMLKARTLWLITTTATDFFARCGYAKVARDQAPEAVRATAQFARLCPDSATVMSKRLR